MAWSLIPALQKAGGKVHQLISRNEKQAAYFSKIYGIEAYTTNLEDINPETELIILTVPDDTIQHVANILLPINYHLSPIIAHTSGSVSIEALGSWGDRAAVFYPMQTFTTDTKRSFSDVPLFLEGNAEVLALLQPLADRMSQRVQVLDSASRAKLHLGAVMVSNFTNLLYTYADELIPGVDIHAYEPLIRGQLENVFSLGPRASQTGPAARGDEATIQRHMEMLGDKPEIQELYAMVSRLIGELKNKK